jgi:hypothetical protein
MDPSTMSYELGSEELSLVTKMLQPFPMDGVDTKLASGT